MTFAVYILAGKSRTLYVGITNDLARRTFEHKAKLVSGFTQKYRVDRLVYYELTPNVLGAIAREKQIKSWRRSKKIALLEGANPTWRDLTEDWGMVLPKPSE